MQKQYHIQKIGRCLLLLLSGCLLLMVGCQDGGSVDLPVDALPTPTTAVPTTVPVQTGDREFIVVATDAPVPPFTDFDQFGNVTGYIATAMAEIAATAGFTYEFVVTPYQGVLENIAAGSTRDFDAVMAAVVLPETPPAGIAFTQPYLEIGQVMVVLADERQLTSYQLLQPDMVVGVPGDSWSELAARQVANVPEEALNNTFENSVQALQALIDEQVTAVIIDTPTATYYTNLYPDQIQIAGGEGDAAWINGRSYAIAVSQDDTMLLEQLNTAITDLQSRGVLEQFATQLIPTNPLRPGESRAGTPADELHIGFLGQPLDMDPAGPTDLISWELKNNTMSGLYRFNANNQLEPLLASSVPLVSEDGLEYTISLRSGLQFPDGSSFTADDVKWSVDRARSLGNFLVNDILKDSDDNNFADDDAVQVVDELTVRFVLQEPLGYFPAILATPPYFPVSSDCYDITWDEQSTCGGIGPYTISTWEIGNRMRLEANPVWPGTPAPQFETLVLRFYQDAALMRRSLERFQSVDMLWTGFPYSQLAEMGSTDVDADGTTDFVIWEGPGVFKSYLIFDQETPPWDRSRIRRAAALSLDREALAALFAGQRAPLLGPAPESVPGAIASLPERNLVQARSFLLEEGYSPNVPLAVELWYVNDGRYSSIEAEYAAEIKRQLEETEVFQVTINGASFDQFRGQIASCGYPAYLIGWPSPGSPTNYLDLSSWTDFFIENTTSGFCSNYENAQMTALVEAAREETDEGARFGIYAQMQTLWAQDLPTLDLLQENRFALTVPAISGVQIDALGLLHYELLNKTAVP